MGWLMDPQLYLSLATLTVLEIVLGIDNIVFVAILAGRLPAEQQQRARQTGLALALITRLALLGSITWIMRLTQPLFTVFGHDLSLRDLVLISGGFFLLYKSTTEIHHRLEENEEGGDAGGRSRKSFVGVVATIVVLDIVFSLDSVITAVGMASDFRVMAAAIVIAVAVMMGAVKFLAEFIARHPTVKILALSFLLLIGMTLIAEGAGVSVPKGYIYAAIGFSIGVEALNQIASGRRSRPAEGETAEVGGVLAEPAMTGLDFRSFLDRHKFTEQAAAAQLGISRKQAEYLLTSMTIPRTVALACAYLDAQALTTSSAARK